MGILFPCLLFPSRSDMKMGEPLAGRHCCPLGEASMRWCVLHKVCFHKAKRPRFSGSPAAQGWECICATHRDRDGRRLSRGRADRDLYRVPLRVQQRPLL